MNILTSSLLGISLFTALVSIEANSECISVSGSDHQVTFKDFTVTSIHEKHIMCGAYFCSHFPTVLPLQLLIHEINSTKDNLAVYLEKRSITSINKCGHCSSTVFEDNKAEKEETCKSCPYLEPSKTIDLYVRLEKPVDFENNNNECAWNVNFNMSVQEYACKEGLPVNIPQAKQCNISTISSSDLQCIVPTCSRDIIVKTDVNNFIHTFIPTNKSEICMWELHVDPPKTVDLIFPPLIKNHVIVYEDNLLRPKWNINECNLVSDNIKIKSSFKRILILYNNKEPLTSEAFLQVNITQVGCSFPKDIQNGYVEFQVLPNGTFAHYSCFENYHLVGDKIINCDKEDSPPVCDQDKEQDELAESDYVKSNISLIELDQGASDAVKSSTEIASTTVTLEGSGHSRLEDENGFSDMVDSDPSLETGTLVTVNSLDNTSVSLSNISFNHTFGSPWNPSEGGIVLFSLPALEDKMLLFIIIGSGVLLVVIITVISLIICRNRSVRSGLNRKFDTFQNPIYEKPVVRVPIPSSDSDPSHEKLDLGDLSDSTILD